MTQRPILWAAFAAALALSACGGDDSNSPSPAPAPTPAPTPSPSPSPSPSPTPPTSSGYFIEPLDTAKQATGKAAEPAAVSRLPAGAALPRVALGPLTQTKQAAPADKAAPLQIGEGRSVDATAAAADLASRLQWNTLADGTQVAALAFSAQGAQAIRLGVLAQALPEGAVLRFYGAAGSPVVEMTAAKVAALRQMNEAAGESGDAARMVWGPDTEGALSTLEVQLPAGTPTSALRLAVPQLSHLTMTVQQAIDNPPRSKDVGDAGSCNQDVMCGSYKDEGRAVARMSFVKGGNSYLCTGTLMNDTKNSRTPYFLTAAHCISSQSTASTLVTYWFFRTASCNGSQLDAKAQQLSGGAQLLYAQPRYDSALLQLNRQPPAGVMYAGSYFGPGMDTGDDVLAIHHPRGDLQKYSIGRVIGFASCPTGSMDSCVNDSASNGGMFQIGWRLGVTEGGSSGSAIFAQANDTRYVVGSLLGGSASCQTPEGRDVYGRFEKAFADGIRNHLAR